MTLDELNENLSADEELRQTFEAKLAAMQPQNPEEAAEAASRIAKEFGYDVPASEFMLNAIIDQEINDEELDRVTGGGSGICDGTASCDQLFLDNNGNRYKKSQRCKFFHYCDEFNYRETCWDFYLSLETGRRVV